MSVIRGACISRARLQATDGVPIPTKQISSSASARAAATAIISVVEYSIIAFSASRHGWTMAGQNVFLHPLQETLPTARDRVPGIVEGVVAPIITMRVGWASTTGRRGNGADGPVWQNGRVGARRAKIIDYLFDRNQRPFRRQHHLLLHTRDAFDKHVAGLVGTLRMNNSQVGSDCRHSGQLLTAE